MFVNDNTVINDDNDDGDNNKEQQDKLSTNRQYFYVFYCMCADDSERDTDGCEASVNNDHNTVSETENVDFYLNIGRIMIIDSCYSNISRRRWTSRRMTNC